MMVRRRIVAVMTELSQMLVTVYCCHLIGDKTVGLIVFCVYSHTSKSLPGMHCKNKRGYVLVNIRRPVQTQALAHVSDKGRVRACALICEYRCAFMCTWHISK